jgi:phosphoglycerate dehydrogenase-like enzyme
MSKPKILFACTIADVDAKARMANYADIIEMDKDPEAILQHIPGKTGLIVPYTPDKLVTREVIDRGTDLQLIGTTYGGVRQNVDEEYALEKGLTVIHTGPSRQRPMAEYTLALVLSSLLQIHNYHHDMRSGDAWPRFKYPRTRILHQRPVGIIGMGMIGQAIADLFKCFTSDIRVYSRHLSDADANAQGLQKLPLDEIFHQCEVIILAGGYTPETHHMIKKSHFDAMQENALFVNIARGQMVDEQAMIEAVRNKPIYLALDVFETEPLAADSPLRNSDRVLITPHRANNAIEFEQRWQCLAEEIERFFTGKTPESALSPDRAKVMSSS